MDRVEHLLPARAGVHRLLARLAALGLAIAMAWSLVQVAHAAIHESRCERLLSNQSPSDYIGFEAEGCRAR